MPPTRDHTEDMRRLRAVIERRITEYGVRHRRRFTTDSNTSKILSERQNPGLFTVRDLATKLDTTVGDLLEEPVLGEADLKKLRELVDFLIARFDLMGARAAASREEKTFVIGEAEFVERDYDYPRPHHVFLVPHSKAAAGRGIESDWEGEMTEVLHSIRDVYGELRVIRVIGESMTPFCATATRSSSTREERLRRKEKSSRSTTARSAGFLDIGRALRAAFESRKPIGRRSRSIWIRPAAGRCGVQRRASSTRRSRGAADLYVSHTAREGLYEPVDELF